MITNSIQNWR